MVRTFGWFSGGVAKAKALGGESEVRNAPRKRCLMFMVQNFKKLQYNIYCYLPAGRSVS